jgi:hypothetical protein
MACMVSGCAVCESCDSVRESEKERESVFMLRVPVARRCCDVPQWPEYSDSTCLLLSQGHICTATPHRFLERKIWLTCPTSRVSTHSQPCPIHGSPLQGLGVSHHAIASTYRWERIQHTTSGQGLRKQRVKCRRTLEGTQSAVWAWLAVCVCVCVCVLIIVVPLGEASVRRTLTFSSLGDVQVLVLDHQAIGVHRHTHSRGWAHPHVHMEGHRGTEVSPASYSTSKFAVL